MASGARSAGSGGARRRASAQRAEEQRAHHHHRDERPPPPAASRQHAPHATDDGRTACGRPRREQRASTMRQDRASGPCGRCPRVGWLGWRAHARSGTASVLLPRVSLRRPGWWRRHAGPYGALQAADANGIQLPAGFTSRLIGTTGPAGRRHRLRVALRTRRRRLLPGRGWRVGLRLELGGAQLVRRRCRARCASPSDGSDRRRLPDPRFGTNRNCAGGPTPWGTWLSCEERARRGGSGSATRSRRARGPCGRLLGTFNHEAAAVDPGLRARVPHRGRPRRAASTGSSRPRRADLSAGSALRGERVGDRPSPGCPPAPPAPDRSRGRPPPFNGGEGAWIGGRHPVVHDQGRPQGVGARPRHPAAHRPLRPRHHRRLAAERGRQHHACTSRRATSSWPRTAATWSCASSPPPTRRTRWLRSSASSATTPRRSPAPPSRRTALASTSARSAAPTASSGIDLRDHRPVPHHHTPPPPPPPVVVASGPVRADRGRRFVGHRGCGRRMGRHGDGVELLGERWRGTHSRCRRRGRRGTSTLRQRVGERRRRDGGRRRRQGAHRSAGRTCPGGAAGSGTTDYRLRALLRSSIRGPAAPAGT